MWVHLQRLARLDAVKFGCSRVTLAPALVLRSPILSKLAPVSRRRFVIAAACGALAGCESWSWRAPEKGPLAAYIPEGDSGAESAYQGVLRIRDRLRIPVTIQRSLGSASLSEALRNLAASDVTLVMVYGSEAADALAKLSIDYPNQRFALIQAEVIAPQVATYSVAHEQSAWLAGTAAGLLSRKKIVGHIGVGRNETALVARAAFYSGLQTALPQSKFLSSFVAQNEVASRIKAQITAGADLIFHTLDGDDAALVTLARQHNVPLIGRGRDWLTQGSGTYAASAIADVGVASFTAGQDLYDGLWKAGLNRRIGVENADAVRLKLAEHTPEAVRQRVDLYQRELKAGGYRVETKYDGREF